MILNDLNNQKEQYSFTDFYNEISGKTVFSTETGIVVEYNSTSDIALKTGMSVNSAISITCAGTSDDDFILFRGNSEARAFSLGKDADMSLTKFFCANGSFTSNESSSDYSQEGGGMIFNKGKITLENGAFSFNKVSANSGCQLDGGGAVYNPTGNLNITSVSFLSNVSQCDGGAVFNGSYDEEDLPVFIPATTISQSNFTYNIASYSGGAVMNHNGILNLQNNLFEGNKSKCDTSGEPSGNEGMGGAIYSSSRTENEDDNSFGFLLSGNTFTNNSAYFKGGAIYSDDESMSSLGDTFHNNSSEQGGAIYLDSPDSSDHSTIDNCTFTANTATTQGGALYIADGSVTISNSTFQENQASHGGGALYIDKDTGTQIIIQNCRFSSESDTIFINSGNVTFSGTNFLSGNIFGNFSLESNATLVMDVSSYTQANMNPIIDRGNMIDSGSLAVNLNVNQAKESGIDYCLVKGGIFHNEIQLWLDGVYTGHTIKTPTSSPMTEVVFGNGLYTLKYNESNNDYTITATKKEDRSFSDISLDIGTYTGELPLFGTFKRTEEDTSGIIISHDTIIIGRDFNDQKLTFDGQNRADSPTFILQNNGNIRLELANAVIKNSGEKGAIDAIVGTVVLKDMTFETISDTISAQYLELAGNISIAGQLESDNYVIVNEGTLLNMDLSVHNPYTPNSAPLFFCDYEKMFRKGEGESENRLTLSVNISDVQKSGSYFLADNASNFLKTITLTGAVSGKISTSETIQSSGRSYTLNVDKDNNLFLNFFENII